MMLQAEQTQLEVGRSRLETEELRLSSLRADLDGIGRENEKYVSERGNILSSIEMLDKELTEAKEKTVSAINRRNDSDDALAALTAEYNTARITEAALRKDVEALTSGIALNESTVEALKEQIERSVELTAALEQKLVDINNRIGENEQSSSVLSSDIGELEAERKRLIEQNIEYERLQSKIRDELRDKNHVRETLFREFTRLEGIRENLSTEHDRLAAKIWEDYELTYTAAAELNYAPVTEETRASYGSRQTELRNKIRALGHVNVGAIEEYADVKTRYDFNTNQYEDLIKARESLNGVIDRLEREMRTKFLTAFEDSTEYIAVAIVMPADGPSFGTAPSGA